MTRRVWVALASPDPAAAEAWRAHGYAVAIACPGLAGPTPADIAAPLAAGATWSQTMASLLDAIRPNAPLCVVCATGDVRPDPVRDATELSTTLDPAAPWIMQPCGDPVGEPGVWARGVWISAAALEACAWRPWPADYGSALGMTACALDARRRGEFQMRHDIAQRHRPPAAPADPDGALLHDIRLLACEALDPARPSPWSDDSDPHDRALALAAYRLADIGFGDAWTARAAARGRSALRGLAARGVGRVACLGAGSLFKRIRPVLDAPGTRVVGAADESACHIDDARETVVHPSSLPFLDPGALLVTTVRGGARLRQLARESVGPTVPVVTITESEKGAA